MNKYEVLSFFWGKVFPMFITILIIFIVVLLIYGGWFFGKITFEAIDEVEQRGLKQIIERIWNGNNEQ